MKLAYNQDIFQTGWLYNEFYTVILLIVFINLVYFTWWLYLTRKEQHPVRPATGRHPVIEVSKAGKTILLRQDEIASTYLNSGYCYMKTFRDEVFVTTYTLEEVMQILDKNYFYRANRQTLISRKSCLAYKSIENGKIELDLNPPLKYTVIVSQKKASEFRKWITASINKD